MIDGYAPVWQDLVCTISTMTIWQSMPASGKLLTFLQVYKKIPVDATTLLLDQYGFHQQFFKPKLTSWVMPSTG